MPSYPSDNFATMIVKLFLPAAFAPSSPISDGICTNYTYAAIKAIPEWSGLIHTDQTGGFPTISNNGKRYAMILYNFDSNTILSEALCNPTGPEILRAYKKLHQTLLA
jgi:hypothetical protein